MGREIKRVPVDFDWPIGERWGGYLNPHYTHQFTCPSCDGYGYNPETKKIFDDWYGLDNRENRWCDNITQDEVDALIEDGRLKDFTHDHVPGEGWKPKDPKPNVTADMINAWSKMCLQQQTS